MWRTLMLSITCLKPWHRLNLELNLIYSQKQEKMSSKWCCLQPERAPPTLRDFSYLLYDWICNREQYMLLHMLLLKVLIWKSLSHYHGHHSSLTQGLCLEMESCLPAFWQVHSKMTASGLGSHSCFLPHCQFLFVVFVKEEEKMTHWEAVIPKYLKPVISWAGKKKKRQADNLSLGCSHTHTFFFPLQTFPFRCPFEVTGL